MKQISFEMPKEMMVDVGGELNDFTFSSLNKIIEDHEYFENIISLKQKFNKPILLNVDVDDIEDEGFNALVELIEPEKIIIQDNVEEFIEQFPNTINKLMVVISGNQHNELVDSYCYYRDYRTNERKDIPFIGIPSTFTWIERIPQKQIDARYRLLMELHDKKIVDKNRQHHLFETWYAREFHYYRDYTWIKSINTVNPIMAGIDGKRYDSTGIFELPLSTFESTYDMKTKFMRMDLIYYNCGTFRKIVNG